MEIDLQRLHDEAYRDAVLTALLRDYQARVFRYCVTRLGEAYGEEVAQEVFVVA
jgi:DNA-directed RNA polymerase specialized sigma24 family protein